MSLPLTTPDWWESGTNQNSVPANNNALRFMVATRDGAADDVTAQPAFTSPADDGKWYIIPAAATGTQWATFAEDSAAIFFGGAWYEFTPVEGDKVSVDGTLLIYSGSGGWEPITLPAAAEWGLITGTLSAQTDLQAALDKVRVQAIQIACSDETTALTTGAAKATFRVPYAFTLTGVRASVTTAPTGSVLTVDINEGGTTILSTKITIDATEKTSTTAATPPVISDTALTDDAEITIDIDTVGSTIAGAGLKVTLIGYAT